MSSISKRNYQVDIFDKTWNTHTHTHKTYFKGGTVVNKPEIRASQTDRPKPLPEERNSLIQAKTMIKKSSCKRNASFSRNKTSARSTNR